MLGVELLNMLLCEHVCRLVFSLPMLLACFHKGLLQRFKRFLCRLPEKLIRPLIAPKTVNGAVHIFARAHLVGFDV